MSVLSGYTCVLQRIFSKTAILRQIVKQLAAELALLTKASRTAHADASDEQNKAEHQYDTRGLETAYLASAQARQATETEEALELYQSLKPQKFTDQTSIALTALVELESNGARRHYFIGPSRGGMEIRHNKTEILVITPESPLGAQLVGKHAGDRIKLQTRGPAQDLRIVSVS